MLGGPQPNRGLAVGTRSRFLVETEAKDPHVARKTSAKATTVQSICDLTAAGHRLVAVW